MNQRRAVAMQALWWKKRAGEAASMEPTDAVKLAYQSEFGCEHILAEESVCARRIEAEIADTAEDPSEPPFGEIGGGVCRLNLRSGIVRRLPPLLLARMMGETARQKQGSAQGFQARLEALRAACGQGLFAFGLATLDSYLTEYAKEGYPPVRHSEAYRAAYKPAYRVVLRGFADVLPILEGMEERLRRHGRCVTVLDGDCGAGKTTLAGLIAPLYEANVISMDDFFLPPSLRTPKRLEEAGGNIHYERFAAEALAGLTSGEPFAYTRFDCHAGRSEARWVMPAPVTLVEGSYSQHPYFLPFYEQLHALRVWVAVEGEEQLRRLERRNPALLPRFVQEWIPLEKAYARDCQCQQKADHVVISHPWEEDSV